MIPRIRLARSLAPAIVLAALAALGPALPAQGVITAADFFKQMQAKYGSFNEYEAKITISSGKTVMSGNISFKKPGLMRIDFDQPANQVICYNGEELQVYLPQHATILSQYVGANQLAMGGPVGLELLGRNFTVGYEASNASVPLDPGSSENVVKLVLEARGSSEGYRRIILSVDPETKLIRRFEGTTVANASFRFDYQGIKLDQGIPETRFAYESPASANVKNNFLYNPE